MKRWLSLKQIFGHVFTEVSTERKTTLYLKTRLFRWIDKDQAHNHQDLVRQQIILRKIYLHLEELRLIFVIRLNMLRMISMIKIIRYSKNKLIQILSMILNMKNEFHQIQVAIQNHANEDDKWKIDKNKWENCMSKTSLKKKNLWLYTT